jgi:hypothetical protein
VPVLVPCVHMSMHIYSCPHAHVLCAGASDLVLVCACVHVFLCVVGEVLLGQGEG